LKDFLGNKIKKEKLFRLEIFSREKKKEPEIQAML